jgi:hypothetical protein
MWGFLLCLVRERVRVRGRSSVHLGCPRRSNMDAWQVSVCFAAFLLGVIVGMALVLEFLRGGKDDH